MFEEEVKGVQMALLGLMVVVENEIDEREGEEGTRIDVMLLI